MAGKFVYHVGFVRKQKSENDFMFGEVTVDTTRPLGSQKELDILQGQVAEADAKANGIRLDDSYHIAILSFSLLTRDGFAEMAGTGRSAYHIGFVREQKGGSGTFSFGGMVLDTDRPIVSRQSLDILRAQIAKADAEVNGVRLDDSYRITILSLSLLTRDGFAE